MGPHRPSEFRAPGLRTRAIVIALALALLLFVLQLARLAEAVPENLLGPSLAARTLVWSLPALLTVSLPLGAFVSIALTYGELGSRGELQAWMTLGLTPHQLMRPALELALLTALFVALTTAWLSPIALRTASQDLQDAVVSLTLETIEQGGEIGSTALEADAADRVGDDLVLHRVQIRDEEIDARAESLSFSIGKPDAQLESVRLDLGEIVVNADQATIAFPHESPESFADKAIPPVETLTLHQLVGESLDSTLVPSPMAAGQVCKRIALSLLPLGLLPLFAGLPFLSAWWWEPGRYAVAGLAGGSVLFALARGSELVGRSFFSGGLTLAVAIVMASVALYVWLIRRTQ